MHHRNIYADTVLIACELVSWPILENPHNPIFPSYAELSRRDGRNPIFPSYAELSRRDGRNHFAHTTLSCGVPAPGPRRSCIICACCIVKSVAVLAHRGHRSYCVLVKGFFKDMPSKARTARKKKLVAAIFQVGPEHPSFVAGPLRPTKTEPLSSPLQFFR